MEQREKLVELLSSVTVSVQYEDGKTVSVKQGNTDELADYLIANGVVVLPCRCCECDYHDHDGGAGYCNYWRRWSNMSDYCNHGKRKGGDE